MREIEHEIRELKSYIQNFRLWKRQWDSYSPEFEFQWECVKFDRANQQSIPNSSGIYAFFVEPRIADFPCHGYLMYIGLAGHRSKNSLKKRYKQYLSEKVDLNRASIYWLLNNWEGYIYFYYTILDDNSFDLHSIEETLLDTFLPPFSKRGFSTVVSNVLKAFPS